MANEFRAVCYLAGKKHLINISYYEYLFKSAFKTLWVDDKKICPHSLSQRTLQRSSTAKQQFPVKFNTKESNTWILLSLPCLRASLGPAGRPDLTDSTRLFLGCMVRMDSHRVKAPQLSARPLGSWLETYGSNSNCCAERPAGGTTKRRDNDGGGGRRQQGGPLVGELVGGSSQAGFRWEVSSTLTQALGWGQAGDQSWWPIPNLSLGQIQVALHLPKEAREHDLAWGPQPCSKQPQVARLRSLKIGRGVEFATKANSLVILPTPLKRSCGLHFKAR